MSESKGGLVTDIRVGESIYIGEAKITIEEKKGQRARLRIQADKSIKITSEKEKLES